MPHNLGFSLWGRYLTFPTFPNLKKLESWKSWKTAQTQCLGNGHGVPVDVEKPGHDGDDSPDDLAASLHVSCSEKS